MSIEGGPEFRVTLEGTENSFPVRRGDDILGAARRAGYWLPFECGWGSCGRCKATVVEGHVASLFPEAPASTERDLRRNRVLLCQSTPTSDLSVRPLSEDREPSAVRPTADYIGVLTAAQELGPSIAEFTFTLDRPAVFLAGQYSILHLAPGLERCYSMSNLPGTTEVRFIVKRYEGHPGSTRMFELGIGDELGLELPFGDMWMRDVDRPAILIAGGTGISAILSLARSIEGNPTWAERKVHVLYGAGSKEELVCWEDLESMTESAQLHGALVSAPDDWTGHKGFVTTALSALLTSELAHEHDLLEAEVYLAGPPVMVNAVQEAARDHGIQLDRVHVDSFG